MVQINFASREVNCKIVYYGPGRCGKTTNLQVVHARAPKGSVPAEMVSIATETDRTLYFDFLPLDLGKIAGMTTKFQLYTVPGQVYYDATRRLVLQGADGIVFVADSNPQMMKENIESLENLERNLTENGLDINTVPMVMQWNKRDLPDAIPVEEMEKQLNRRGCPSVSAVAVTGEGVMETLKLVAQEVIRRLNRQQGYSEDGEKRTEPARKAGVGRPPAAGVAASSPPRPPVAATAGRAASPQPAPPPPARPASVATPPQPPRPPQPPQPPRPAAPAPVGVPVAAVSPQPPRPPQPPQPPRPAVPAPAGAQAVVAPAGTAGHTPAAPRSPVVPSPRSGATPVPPTGAAGTQRPLPPPRAPAAPTPIPSRQSPPMGVPQRQPSPSSAGVLAQQHATPAVPRPPSAAQPAKPPAAPVQTGAVSSPAQVSKAPPPPPAAAARRPPSSPPQPRPPMPPDGRVPAGEGVPAPAPAPRPAAAPASGGGAARTSGREAQPIGSQRQAPAAVAHAQGSGSAPAPVSGAAVSCAEKDLAGGAGGGKLFAEPQKKKGCLGVLVVTVTVSWLIAAVAGAIFG